MSVQLHIEQGPVLEAEGLPLGVVEAIAGQTRLTVSIMNTHVSYLLSLNMGCLFAILALAMTLFSRNAELLGVILPNSMGRQVGSWFLMLFIWLFCIQYL